MSGRRRQRLDRAGDGYRPIMGRCGVAAVLGAGALSAAMAGCAAPPDLLGTHTAQVTIKGVGTETVPVHCDQVRWRWTIETVPRAPGFTAMVNTATATASAGLVHFRDLGGFSGTFGRDIVGDAQARVDDGTFVISGTAVGSTEDQPTEETPHDFTIETNC